MRKKKYEPLISQKIDFPIFEFLWNLKLSSIDAIAIRVFHGNLQSAYTRLNKLQKGKYIKQILISENQRYWTLDKKGFEFAKAHILPELRENGYKSENPIHDILVSSIQLGPFIRQPSDKYTIYTDQMLRRYALNEFPDIIPNPERHRPDGYWMSIEIENSFIALEVERNIKAVERYKSVQYFYNHHPQVKAVIWAVESMSSAKRLYRYLDGPNSPEFLHKFITIDQCIKMGWQAPFLFKQDRILNLNELLQEAPYNSPQTTQKPVLVSPLLTGRVSYRSPIRNQNWRL